MTYRELDGLPARRQGLLIATASRYAPDWLMTWGQDQGSFRSHWSPLKGADLTLRLEEDDVPILGRLLDHDGRPLGGARVRLNALKVPWKHDLDAHLDKFKRSLNKVWMFDYDRSLERPWLLPGVASEVFTDRDGRFQISGLGRERLADLLVTAPSVVDTRLTVMTRNAPDVVIERDATGDPKQAILGAGFTFQLKIGQTFSGVVRDRETHQPIPGMWVGMQHDPLNGLIDGEYPWSTDQNGRFTITGQEFYPGWTEITAVPQPGQLYPVTKVKPDGIHKTVIECPRGIPFRLRVSDEQGRPVEAEVSYEDVQPNPYTARIRFYDGRWPINRAAKRGEGIYEGFVLPGPGAVLVKTPGRPDYRAAHIDPKAFFGPGRPDWSEQERTFAYGNDDSLAIGGWSFDQRDYAAIVLVNPTIGSRPLELSARVERDQPRQVSLIDPEGKPLVGVTSEAWLNGYYSRSIRTSTFSLQKLHPDRVQRILFYKEDRKLVGFLLARGDGDTPYTVQLQPWATITGRIVMENGVPFPTQGPPDQQLFMTGLSINGPPFLTNSDPDPKVGGYRDVKVNEDGRFRVEQLVPGQRYTGTIFRMGGQFAGMAFQDLVLQSGEVRDLGKILTKPAVNVIGK
jgi:hypothetical protein